MNEDQLVSDLIRDEGVELKPYRDTVGKLTIGCGFNLDDVGLYPEEVNFILHNRIRLLKREMDHDLPWWRVLSEARQRGLMNMAYNLGIPKLTQFKKMLSALRGRDWQEAAKEALASKWAGQVGARAHRISELFLKG